MIDLSKHQLLKDIHETMLAVEDCGSTPELTRVTNMLAKLMTDTNVFVDKMVAMETQTMPHIWKANTTGLIEFISDEQYQDLPENVQKHYDQYIVNRLPIGCKWAILMGGATVCKHHGKDK